MSFMDRLSNIFNHRPTNESKPIFEAIDQSLRSMSQDIDLMQLETEVTTATGEWLDAWGDWFGVPRISGEKDRDYGNRILALVTTPKNTIPAIQKAIQKFIGDPYVYVRVYEPYNNLMKYNVSSLNGVDRMMDEVYWRHCVIEVSIASTITKEMMDTINQIKGAGIKVYFAQLTHAGDPETNGVITFKGVTLQDVHTLFELLCPFIPQITHGATYSSTTYKELVVEHTSQTYSSGCIHNTIECEPISSVTGADSTVCTLSFIKPTSEDGFFIDPPRMLFDIKDEPLSNFVSMHNHPFVQTQVSP